MAGPGPLHARHENIHTGKSAMLCDFFLVVFFFFICIFLFYFLGLQHGVPE